MYLVRTRYLLFRPDYIERCDMALEAKWELFLQDMGYADMNMQPKGLEPVRMQREPSKEKRSIVQGQRRPVCDRLVTHDRHRGHRAAFIHVRSERLLQSAVVRERLLPLGGLCGHSLFHVLPHMPGLLLDNFRRVCVRALLHRDRHSLAHLCMQTVARLVSYLHLLFEPNTTNRDLF